MALEIDLVGEAADRHVVHFYDHDEELAAGVGPYLAEAIRTGGTAIVIATEEHRQAFTAHLQHAGLNPWPASASLLMVDAREAADALLFDGRIAPHRFDKLIGDLVREAAGRGRPTWAYGEIVAVLWADGHVRAALELEELWNDLGREVDFALYCAYPRAWMEAEGDAFHEVCRRHSAVVGPPVAPEQAPAMPCELEAEFPWSGRSPGQARHFVVDTLAAWDCWAFLDDAALITTELATNAILHAQTGFTVVVSRRPEGSIRIAVRDASLVRPRPREAGPFETSGRGLRLVAALAARWGSEPIPAGKMIWAELEVPAVIAS
ncbi:MAG TPA: MEDS domain-containing protein [Acidimicrobiia bacterium]|nr:MEDS domain-containing protein [Acidimicrobiia bacterium]